jgi:hypothetical protein
MKVTPDIIRYELIGTQAKSLKAPMQATLELAGPVVAKQKTH